MKVAYDLIIIGNLAHSLSIAEYALKYNARTALINLSYSDDRSLFLNKYKSNYLVNEDSVNYEQFLAEEKLILKQHWISHCQKLGLDIINDRFKFIENKKLAIQTTTDTITTSDYLLNISPELIFVEDNEYHNLITLDDIILQNKWSILPHKLAIFGHDITAINLAIYLVNLDKEISFFSKDNCLLPYEDEDISWQLQLHLEAKGIKFYFDTIDASKINFDNQYEQVIITETKINYQQKYDQEVALYDRFNLTNVGVKIDRHRILVNSKLQTDNPNIYACGDSLGGYSLDNVTEYEAKIAVENALFIPWQKTDYSQIPYSLPTNPPIYRLGCTEKQARLLYGQRIKIIVLNSSISFSSSLMGDNRYFIKLIIDRSQQIIGFHCLGNQPEILATITLMMRNKQPLKYLFQSNFVDSKTYEIIKEIKQKWKQENQGINDMITDLTKTFLIWKNG